MKQQYDVVVLGAGSAGLTAAVGFSKVGKSVLLVEREHMGGECTNTGCIPSKALLHHAKTFYTAKQIAGDTTRSEAFRAEAYSYVRNTIEHILAEETPETFAQMGINVVRGEATFTSKREITVASTTYTYHTAIIATGSQPRMIDIDGLDPQHVLTNQNLFALDEIPKKLLIIGGGPIGMEMAQACAMLGSQVTIAERGDTFASLEDHAIQPIVHAAFVELGITIMTNAAITSVDGTTAHFNSMDDDSVTGQFATDFDKVLIAIGRTPNLPAGLADAGITHDAQRIIVDNNYQTSNKHVYAIGDVSQSLKFTHTADDTARQVVARVASKGLLRVNRRKAVPKVTYTTPEIAQVGLSWSAAIAKYSEERIMRIEVPLQYNDRAKTDAATEGMLVVIARRLSGTVLGAHIIGPAAGEILNIFTLAIDQKISLWKLQKLIFAYPTYSLIVKKAADQFVGRQLADLKPDIISAVQRNLLKIILGVTWVIGLWFLYQYQQSHNMTVAETALMIFDFVSMTIWGPLLYIAIYTLRPLTFFPGTALTILSGVFFGLWGGIVYTIIAANLSAALAYSVGRFFGKDLKLEDTGIGVWVNALQKNPFESVLTTRLIFLPFDVVSYAAGILKLPFVSFILATLVGTLLGIATFVAIGAAIDVPAFRENGFSTEVIDTTFILLSIGILVVSLTLSRFLKRWRAE